MALLRTRLSKRKEGEVIRFSSLGKKDRQLWYQANMPEVAEKFSGRTLFKFMFGDCVEVLTLFLAKEAGHEVTHMQHEVEIAGVKGHTDAVIDGVPADVKSASTFSFQKFKDGSLAFNDAFGYIPQLAGYANALGMTDRAGFLAVDKQHGDICWSELSDLDIKANPPGPRIEHLKEVIKQPEPPARCYSPVPEGKSGNMKLGVGCSYCPFRDECWKDSNDGAGLRMFFYSRGPVWLTEVCREPKVNEA